ncbi:insertion sequence domain protein [Shigella flexneri K-227]|uniref:Insertion sequence domain protein n=1 Tax=Shigella flexneri K-227 TaxID=766147 RepID=F5P4Y4_SHIFL|nr:insertion sequence domain protein [Shigella flexneri K-227]EGK31156.1 insertion sequence domain protein [Shigella flexneri K-227]KDT32083.1 putative insertion sequence domain protein [Escherichia coli 3-105-05_S1_C1]KDU49242.1 putative insertion sequence domain protein [Escherichia coli 3-475-03_S4_C2]
MPAFEWVHVQLHQQKGMISLSPPTICNSASVVAVLVNESQTKMPCTRLLFSMQSGPQRNYVGSVSIAGR